MSLGSLFLPTTFVTKGCSCLESFVSRHLELPYCSVVLHSLWDRFCYRAQLQSIYNLSWQLSDFRFVDPEGTVLGE